MSIIPDMEVPDIAGDFAQIVDGLGDATIASGKSGSVMIGETPVAAISRWMFDCRTHTLRYAASDSGGFLKTTPGAKHGSGTLDGLWNAAAACPLANGQPLVLVLQLTTDRFYTVPAVIRRMQLAVEILRGDVIAFAAEFETDGPWTEPSFS